MSSDCTSTECITALAALLKERRTGNNVFIASLTLLIYDYFLTTPLEIKHIWSSRLTIVNFLYYAVKYGVVFEFVLNAIQQTTDMSTAHCRVIYWVKCYLYNVFTWAAEALVGISVWAAWQKDRRLTISMPLAFVAFSLVSHIYLGIWLDSFKLADPPSPLVRGCFVTSTSNDLNKPIIMVMAWISLMFVLITVSAIRTYKDGSTSTFIQMFYTQGMLYYVYLFCLHLFNLLALYYGPVRVLSTRFLNHTDPYFQADLLGEITM
ncbi:hypothetical protein M378DRAFT_355865 [Amanita muscaria Koide BX008]|uniref:DUF6533 domain-containing protein n=1 Tax=Amanita muscaria (strain Koide BX008) TaxID=946122 RepID=A0A0C2S5G5_AMAMK|nr:hypothetical protein M378DRAFT_355865 [Amanita muscaria Koide BX008]